MLLHSWELHKLVSAEFGDIGNYLSYVEGIVVLSFHLYMVKISELLFKLISFFVLNY